MMVPRSSRRWRVRARVAGLACVGSVVGLTAIGLAQEGVTSQRWGWYQTPPRFPDHTADRRFAFARVMYESVTSEPRG